MIRRYRRLTYCVFCSAILSFLIVSFFGCAAQHKKATPVTVTNDDFICEVREEPVNKSEGSLWRENATLNEMFMDPRARRVGDVVTISIVESSSASNDADTDTSTSSSVSMSISNFLGLENNDRFPTGSGFDPFGSITGTTNNTFQGSGATNRSGKLAASITARVTKVFPNGNLGILGKREITINNEKQYLALTGIIRPRDISSANVVLSTYISDAKIVYTGTGVINDKQEPGWLVRVLDTVWPF
ncbi:MAG: flagellar basal body L-ring protein FlgH [Deltaproteobacteria bacterium]|nr:flagellar basal body L-ring protein FlgH [Deltaproteobacteria bacterium]MBW2219152.1 flagellar basal body L-ring protein FlgH [Deltaproteobacteria bacterium]